MPIVWADAALFERPVRGAYPPHFSGAIYTLTVKPVNDKPTIQAPSMVAAAKQAATPVAGIVIGDVDSGSGSLTLTMTATRGTLSLADDVVAGLSASDITANNTASVTVAAPLAAINATLSDANGLTYTGLLNLVGADTIQLSVNDNGASGEGGAKSAMDSISVAVSGSLKDVWRNAHFSVALLTDPTKEATHWGDSVDPDGDQQDNHHEFVVDTDPNSMASKFDFRILPGDNGRDLIFSPIRPGRSYSVEYFDQLGGSAMSLSGGAASDQGEVRTVSDSANAPRRFYRVVISVAE